MNTPPPFPAHEPPSLTPAQPLGRLGEYHLLKKIAQGGMAEIFLAKRVGMGGFEKVFVIKRMLDSLSGSQEFVSMFYDEARLAARLSHNNIAQIYDFGMIDGRYYIAMEHIAGEDMRAVIGKLCERNVKIPIPIALKIMIDVCAGLEYAHTLSEGGKPLGIIHRDVSPSNIMVSYQGAVKLLDFGIAKATERMTETRTGNIKGKFSFLSPEQIKGLPIDARADVFSLGISFYEVITKRRPFRRENELATIHAILNDELPNPRALRDNVPEDVAAILMKALERDQDKRFRSAGEMGAALQAALTRLAPGTSASDLGSFMLALFGRPAMEQRSEIPSVSSVDAGAATPPPVPVATPHPPGAESSRTGSLTAPGPPLRGKLGWMVGALGMAAAGATIAVLLMKGPVASSVATTPTPAPAAPAATTPTPAAAAAPSPTTAPAAPSPTAAPAAPVQPQVEPVAPQPAAARSRPRPSTPEKLEPLTGETLQAVVRKSHPRFSACFKRHTAELPGASGQVTVEVAVGASGRVSSAQATLPGFSSAALASCLEGEAERLRFPRHPDKELRFTFPLVYRKGAE